MNPVDTNETIETKPHVETIENGDLSNSITTSPTAIKIDEPENSIKESILNKNVSLNLVEENKIERPLYYIGQNSQGIRFYKDYSDDGRFRFVTIHNGKIVIEFEEMNVYSSCNNTELTKDYIVGLVTIEDQKGSYQELLIYNTITGEVNRSINDKQFFGTHFETNENGDVVWIDINHSEQGDGYTNEFFVKSMNVIDKNIETIYTTKFVVSGNLFTGEVIPNVAIDNEYIYLLKSINKTSDYEVIKLGHETNTVLEKIFIGPASNLEPETSAFDFFQNAGQLFVMNTNNRVIKHFYFNSEENKVKMVGKSFQSNPNNLFKISERIYLSNTSDKIYLLDVENNDTEVIFESDPKFESEFVFSQLIESNGVFEFGTYNKSTSILKIYTFDIPDTYLNVE